MFWKMDSLYLKCSDLPDPLFKIRPDPDCFFKLISGRNRIFFKIKIRPEPDPDFFLITIRPEPDPDLILKLRSGFLNILSFM